MDKYKAKINKIIGAIKDDEFLMDLVNYIFTNLLLISIATVTGLLGILGVHYLMPNIVTELGYWVGDIAFLLIFVLIYMDIRFMLTK